jgi:drug/metabolite transporter (DMT)-like permease
MRTEFICIAIVALAWGSYPLIARSSGVGGPLGALVLTLSALVPITALLLWQGTLGQSAIVRPASVELTKLIIAGMIMGIGTAAFNFVANSRQLDASISIPIIDTAMLMITVVGAIVFFAEPITAKKLVGIGLLIAGIAVLKPE